MPDKRTLLILTLTLLQGVIVVPTARATHPCTSPLILDLESDGILVWSPRTGVDFDIDGDGLAERISWTGIGRDAFLWRDNDGNRTVDDGTELFGTATLLPDGTRAENGFQALASLDAPDAGGNGDGILDSEDLGWRDLLLWVDENRNGISEPSEISPLAREGVWAIDLNYTPLNQLDGNGNLWAYEGSFVQQVRRKSEQRFRVGRIVDVFFRVEDTDSGE